MEMYNRTLMLSDSFEHYAENLDIPEGKYLEAKKRYEVVGEWLSEKDSPLAKYSPEIYPQGSFCLGTVVKPLSNNDEYDVDLVCFLAGLKKENISQSQLKKMVGERLLENGAYKRLLDAEGRRCWTLNYANEFHMDILPAIADDRLRLMGGLYSDAVLITDKKMIDCNDQDWPKSNPKGYAKWFNSRQETIFMSMKKSLAESSKVKIEDIPDYRIKTPLQQSIQILKRHRDIYFSKKKDENKPISIIISTVSAILYKGQNNVYGAIYDILSGINETLIKKGNSYFIINIIHCFFYARKKPLHLMLICEEIGKNAWYS